jgi:transposase
MKEKRKNKSYSKEFKEETVTIVTEQGYSVADAAKAVGVRTNLETSARRVKVWKSVKC